MKTAIISDIHDNIPSLEKFLTWAKKNQIAELIVCGDLAAPATLSKVLAPGFKGKIHLVFGNVCDREVEIEKAKEFENVIHYKDLAEFEIENKKVAAIHYPDKARQLAESGKYDFVFYGHTHEARIEEVGKTKLVNPGTLGGMFSYPTFIIWDTEIKNLELKSLAKI